MSNLPTDASPGGCFFFISVRPEVGVAELLLEYVDDAPLELVMHVAVLLDSGKRRVGGRQGMGSSEPAGKCQQGGNDREGEERQERKVLPSRDRLRDRQTPEEGERSEDYENATRNLPTPNSQQTDQNRQVSQLSKPHPGRWETLGWVQEPLLQMLDEKRAPEQEQSKGQDSAGPADDRHGVRTPSHGMLIVV